jgi:hypothetical protein
LAVTYVCLGTLAIIAAVAVAGGCIALSVTLGEMGAQVADWCAHFEEIQAEATVRLGPVPIPSLRALATLEGNQTEVATSLPTSLPSYPVDDIVEGIFRINVPFQMIRGDVDAFADLFRDSITGALGCPRDRLRVNDVREGSIIVTFEIVPGPGDSSLRLLEAWRAQLLDVNSTMMRDTSFGGFAERGSLRILPVADQFEHSPLTRAELAELEAMGGMAFLESVCVPDVETHPLSELQSLFIVVTVLVLGQALTIGLTFCCACQQTYVKSSPHSVTFVDMNADGVEMRDEYDSTDSEAAPLTSSRER